MKFKNIVYIRDLSQLGGVETFTYELIKKYHNLDIAVIYKYGDPSQVKRILKYAPAFKHTDQKIECEVAIINYDITIIPFIAETAKIYQVIHGDYENEAYKWKPPTHPRITAYIGITQHIVESFKRITGLKNVMLSYNPLTIEQRTLLLISGTRLSTVKGKDRMIKLAKALDEREIDYKWLIFTNDKDQIPSPNVFYIKPTINFSKFISRADWLVQLSDTEGLSYSINEALYQNIPVIVTPLPYLEEIGVKDNENALIMNFDCSNIESIVDRIEEPLQFIFKPLKDNYGAILKKSKSKYTGKYLTCIIPYTDQEQNKEIKIGDIIECTEERAKYLIEKGVAKYE